MSELEIKKEFEISECVSNHFGGNTEYILSESSKFHKKWVSVESMDLELDILICDLKQWCPEYAARIEYRIKQIKEQLEREKS